MRDNRGTQRSWRLAFTQKVHVLASCLCRDTETLMTDRTRFKGVASKLLTNNAFILSYLWKHLICFTTTVVQSTHTGFPYSLLLLGVIVYTWYHPSWVIRLIWHQDQCTHVENQDHEHQFAFLQHRKVKCLDSFVFCFFFFHSLTLWRPPFIPK